MLNNTLKRTATTLGVLAGLLAAAEPASAQLPATTVGVTSPHTGPNTPASAISAWHEAARNGPVTNRDSAGHTAHVEVGMGMSKGFLKAPQLGAASDVPQLSLTQQGTQIGSEGVKAPTPTAGTQVNNAGWILPPAVARPMHVDRDIIEARPA